MPTCMMTFREKHESNRLHSGILPDLRQVVCLSADAIASVESLNFFLLLLSSLSVRAVRILARNVLLIVASFASFGCL